VSKELRLRLLELLYAYSTAPEHEKASALRELDRALNEARAATGVSRQELSDYLRTHHYPEYYRMRRKQDIGKIS